MSYLAAFLAQHARGKAQRAEPTKPAKDPSTAFAGFLPLHLARDVLSGGLAIREVLGFPASLLPQLPIPTTLVLELPGMASRVLIATHAGCPPRSFRAAEWLAIVSRAADGDASSEALKAWCLGRDRAQLAAEPRAGSRTVQVAHVIAAYGCTLRAIVLEGELSHG